MKLIFDENLSEKILLSVSDLFPDSTQVKLVGLSKSDDATVWEWARQEGFVIVSKDTDFHQRAVVSGHPPKVVWLRIGNCPTKEIIQLLRARYEVIREFIESETDSLLVLEK